MSSKLPCILEIKVPFPDSTKARIALDTLSPDPVLRPEELERVLSLESPKPEVAKNGGDGDWASADEQGQLDSSVLIATFYAVSDRVLRVAVNGLFEDIKLIVQCMDSLSPERFGESG